MFFEINIFKPNKIDLCVKRSEVNLDHYLKEFGSTRVPDASYQVSRSSAILFWKRIFLRFLPYMGMAAIFAMWPWTFEETFAPITFNVNWLSASEEKMFENVDDGRRTAFGSGKLIKVDVHLDMA